MEFHAVETIKILPSNQGVLVLLGASALEKVLPITIGQEEALAITRPLENIAATRPLTHDLLHNVLEAMSAPLLKVEVYDLMADVFYARLILKQKDEKELQIDSRPSDAIALALRFAVPIYISRELVDKAGIETESTHDQNEEDGFRPVESMYGEPASYNPKDLSKSVRVETNSNDDAKSEDFDLEKLLEEAVRREDYEEAARIRDQIREGK